MAWREFVILRKNYRTRKFKGRFYVGYGGSRAIFGKSEKKISGKYKRHLKDIRGKKERNLKKILASGKVFKIASDCIRSAASTYFFFMEWNIFSQIFKTLVFTIGPCFWYSRYFFLNFILRLFFGPLQRNRFKFSPQVYNIVDSNNSITTFN